MLRHVIDEIVREIQWFNRLRIDTSEFHEGILDCDTGEVRIPTSCDVNLIQFPRFSRINILIQLFADVFQNDRWQLCLTEYRILQVFVELLDPCLVCKHQTTLLLRNCRICSLVFYSIRFNKISKSLTLNPESTGNA